MRGLLFILLLFTTSPLVAQLTGIYTDYNDKLQSVSGDSLSIASAVTAIYYKALSEGYAAASIDTVTRSEDTLYYNMYYGRQYKELHVTLDSTDQVLIRQAGQRPQEWTAVNLDPGQISGVLGRISRHLGNHGYPFHRLHLDSVDLDSSPARAQLAIDKGPLITFDNFQVSGSKQVIRPIYLVRYLGIEQGQPYHHDRVLALRQKLRNLPFIQMTGSPRVNFVNGMAEVVLPFEAKKASRFDFIVGLVPNDRPDGEQGYTFTGEFLGEMVNRFGHGESIYAQIRRMRPEVQEVDLRVDYPYLFGLPIGIDADFKMLLNSDSFIEVDAKGGIQLILSGNDRIGVQLASRSNRLLSIDTNTIIQQRQLPDQLDVNFNSGALTLDMQHLDYRFNPSRGWSARATVGAGVRNIIRNSTITELSTPATDFDLAYDSLNTSSLQTDVALYADYYIPPNRWSTIKLGMHAGYKYNAAQLYDNELYRIGGNRILRGFEEQSILTDRYAVLNLEYRLLLGKDSYLSLPIIDYAWYHSNDTNDWESAISVGMGLNFATAAGIFNVSFVAGGREDIQLNLQTAKIHFGYVSLF